MTEREEMPDGVGDTRAEAEGEVALARLALDDGELKHAAAHLANAVASDPSLADVYTDLAGLADRAGDVEALFPLTGRLYAGTVAARSYLMYRAGQVDEAFALLCRVAAVEPGRPWAAGWLAGPGSPPAVASRLEPGRAARSLTQLALALPSRVPPELAVPLDPFLAVARNVAARQPDDASLLAPLSGLARRLGAYDEAIDWCRRAERSGGGAMAAIMLGYALRDSGRPDEAHAAWVRALGLDPANVNLRVDIAELLAARGRAADGLPWLEEGLAREPDHPKAFPAHCELRFQLDQDVAHLVRLADWWRDHPEHAYAGKMLAKACGGRPWVGMVPFPNEAVAALLRNLAKGRDLAEIGDTEIKLSLSAIEVPSAIAALRSAVPGLRFTEDPPAPAPDIRVPLAEGRYRLWAYAGTEALPVPPPPTAPAVAALRSAAAGGYPPHPPAAYDAAVALSGLGLDDLLGLMAHPVPMPDAPWWQRAARISPMYWPRSAQAWACLGLLHYRPGEPWPSSSRRTVLVDLLRGVEDWAADAAMNALVVAAWTDPTVRDDVMDLVARRFLDAAAAYRHREVTTIGPMAHLVLAAPGMIADVRDLASDIIKREEKDAASAG
jgi:tetratricopeptide (TPR) repeat protein